MPPSRLRLGELIYEVFNASLRHQIHTPPGILNAWQNGSDSGIGCDETKPLILIF